ncbi:MAG TPA: sigma-70 family RNA polymerase sigma factor [Chthoniobacterales bacterium]|nr:sigma-70 family RNA polymerase sigma factor [Chthoniobacterales bacterium]
MIGPQVDPADLSEPPASDEELMQAITDGHHAAIGALFRRHGRTLKKVIFQVLHDAAEADDVLQECLMQVWGEAGRYSADCGRPLGWLLTIARRRAIDRMRRRRAYSMAKERFGVYVEHEPRSWLRDRTDADTSGPDIRHFLESQITRLPAFQREAIELSFFRGLSHREIAAHTRTPLGTVKTRLELGLRKLTTCVLPLRGKV